MGKIGEVGDGVGAALVDLTKEELLEVGAFDLAPFDRVEVMLGEATRHAPVLEIAPRVAMTFALYDIRLEIEIEVFAGTTMHEALLVPLGDIVVVSEFVGGHDTT
jgi:hypothetical protein